MSMYLLFLSPLLLIMLAFFLSPWLRSRFPNLARGRLGRITGWFYYVEKHEAEVKTATFGDLMLILTLYVAGVTLVEM